MIKAAIKIHLLSALLVCGHPTEFALPAGPSAPNIGHIHVFADGGQTIRLLVPGNGSVKAQLYRRAGTTVVPAGEPIAVPCSGHEPTAIKIDFPRSEKVTRYTLVFFSAGRSRIDITALPLNHLDPLRKIAGGKPIVLVHPPQGVADALRRLDVPCVTQGPEEAGKEDIVVLFRDPEDKPAPVKARRVIMVEPPARPDREIWVSSKPGSWQVTVPARCLTREVLLTASGQAKLTELLLGTQHALRLYPAQLGRLDLEILRQ